MKHRVITPTHNRNN